MIITSGKFKGKKVTAPNAEITRPTLSQVRMSVFNILQSILEFEKSSLLDMFAGSGIIGLEALSRGFGYVTAIEKNPKVINILKSNYQNIVKDNSTYRLRQADSLKITPKLKEKFDVIYIDPPYFSGIYEKSLNSVKNIASNIIILEHVTDVDFSGFEPVKQKRYGNKYLTVLKITQDTKE